MSDTLRDAVAKVIIGVVFSGSAKDYQTICLEAADRILALTEADRAACWEKLEEVEK